MFDSRALTKVQSAALIAVIAVAAVGGGIYFLWNRGTAVAETIRIGVCADLDMPTGKDTWQGAILAAEQLNAEGGILGRNITIVAEDDDSFTGPDIQLASNAMTKLMTADQADYIISGGQFLLPYQEISAQHKKILLSVYGTVDNFTQQVQDNYDKYKYSFRIGPCNQSVANAGMLGDMLTVCNYTGFNKVAYLSQDFGASWKQMMAGYSNRLSEHGIEVVYTGFIPITSADFSSYLAAAEESGAQVLFPMIMNEAVTSLVKEWYNRQSPFVLWGVMWFAAESGFWNLTEGKCDTVSFAGSPSVAGYPLTNKTVPTREAYLQRWGEVPTETGIDAYDSLKLILSDAIKRAGTTETESVIKTLETVDVETSSARHFTFTSSHDPMVGSGSINDPAYKYRVMCIFQWQNGTQVPMKPVEIMREVGATYKYPTWEGPWTKR